MNFVRAGLKWFGIVVFGVLVLLFARANYVGRVMGCVQSSLGECLFVGVNHSQDAKMMEFLVVNSSNMWLYKLQATSDDFSAFVDLGLHWTFKSSGPAYPIVGEVLRRPESPWWSSSSYLKGSQIEGVYRLEADLVGSYNGPDQHEFGRSYHQVEVYRDSCVVIVIDGVSYDELTTACWPEYHPLRRSDLGVFMQSWMLNEFPDSIACGGNWQMAGESRFKDLDWVGVPPEPRGQSR